MPTQIQQRLVVFISLAFAMLNALFFYFQLDWFAGIPLAILVIGIALFRLDVLIYIIVLTTPLSITFEDVGGGLGLTLPTDPLMFGAMLVFILKVLFDMKYDYRILKHPISLAILAQLIWIFFTSITSELPLVSFKYFLARLWYVIPFFFIVALLFKYPKKVNTFWWMYMVPLSGVIIYTVIRHGLRGFGDEPAHWVMQPFFSDHTGYGAMIAFCIPIAFVYQFRTKWDINTRILAGFVFTVLIIGVVLSYTRAAWVSLVVALVLMILIAFRVKWWIVALGGLGLIGVFFSFQVEIMHKLEKNKQDSSSDFAEHVESISNVATDASNLERLNRWDAAFKMFFEDPVVGKGPGTYKFLYAPYQHSSNITIISTNFGDGGNAHSEYFGPLAEQGVLGILLVLVILFTFYYTGIPLYYKLVDKDERWLLMAVLLSVTTYFVHGALNNFLDQDKASVPIWAAMALVVVYDIYGKRKKVEE